ncbi:hypothetical protein EDM56_11775 [Brevibacillus fluminis]|uniref:MmyB-like transcription regulator ligand binding domain-containing protein n=1 Tax=Brevibacillus fluminis TaxID=511487 RepID=A0A3M8DNZ3_9BACL|nr:hypothetical protein [Brevibacillus fluminis]RNB89833.1 hypothetical protein EDM56_11775 [Brevibacillus fluminis]
MALIDELHECSAEFREWWPRHDVLDGPEGRKINYDPTAGILVFEQLSFHVAGSTDLTVTINMPTNEFDTKSKLAVLLAQTSP